MLAGMRRFFIAAVLAMSAFNSLASCSGDEPAGAPEKEQPALPDGNGNGNGNPDSGSGEAGGGQTGEEPSGGRIAVKVGDQVFAAILYEHAAARAFKGMLPMEVEMNEQGGNEKYCFLPDDLPADASSAGNVRSGDLMVWGTDCLVLFYKSFSSSYRYTKLGRVENPSGLAAAAGGAAVRVRFETAEQGAGL